MPTRRIIDLLERHNDGSITPEEQLLLDRWFEQHGKPGNSLADMPETEREAWIDELYTEIRARNQAPEFRPRTSMGWYRWVPYAAAVLLVAAAVAFFAIGDRWSANRGEASVMTPILPGGNRAALMMADGRTITLDEGQTGIIVGDEDITYTDGVSLGLPPADTLTLSTPKGGTYAITLPDGSRIWLNANSTLKYPTRFAGDSRDVFLVGEAFFDIEPVRPPLRSEAESSVGGRGGRDGNSVGRERLPFKVITNKQTVEVLGTEFNVSAYAEDAESKTTLVEGSVRMNAKGEQLQLLPGEQGTTGRQLTKTPVNVQQAIAWREGRFDFTDRSLQEAMSQLARWYDLEVRYEGVIPGVEFYGTINRNQNFETVLKLLENNKITYRLSGRNLTIVGN